MQLADLTLQSIAFRLLTLTIVAGVQGWSMAAAAVVLGDAGPKYDGRLTILPTSHIDLVGTISLIAFGLGWAKPIAIDAQQFRMGRIGIIAVILAGFFGALVTAALLNALILPALTTLPHTAGLSTAAFLRIASSLTIWLALLSLIPVPPLTGGMLLGAYGIRVSRQGQWLFTAVLLVGIATGGVRRLLGPAHALLASVVLGQ